MISLCCVVIVVVVFVIAAVGTVGTLLQKKPSIKNIDLQKACGSPHRGLLRFDGISLINTVCECEMKVLTNDRPQWHLFPLPGGQMEGGGGVVEEVLLQPPVNVKWSALPWPCLPRPPPGLAVCGRGEPLVDTP